jgi:hypothetical protein
VSKGPKTADEFFAYREALGLPIARPRHLWSAPPVELERWPGDNRSSLLSGRSSLTALREHHGAAR